MGVRAIFALTCAALAVGCTPAALAQDDLRAKIPRACRTLEGCLLLRDEAQRRVDECAPEGHCSDARDDAADVARRVARFQAQRSENQAKTDRQADERRERLEQDEEQERQRKRTVEQSLQSEYARALDDCATQALASTTPPTFDCHFVVADPALEARRVECATACKEETEKLVALRPSPSSQPTPVPRASASPTTAPASRPAPTSRPETGGGGGTALLCCDGSLSPTRKVPWTPGLLLAPRRGVRMPVKRDSSVGKIPFGADEAQASLHCQGAASTGLHA